VIYECGEPRWNVIDKEKLKNSEKILSQCQFFTTNTTLTDPGANPGANPGLHGQRPETNSLSHEMTMNEKSKNFVTYTGHLEL
jgi:hypothetical protein